MRYFKLMTIMDVCVGGVLHHNVSLFLNFITALYLITCRTYAFEKMNWKNYLVCVLSLKKSVFHLFNYFILFFTIFA